MTALVDAEISARLENYAARLGGHPSEHASEYEDGGSIWTALCADIEDALARNLLSTQTVRMAHAISIAVQSIATGTRAIESISHTVQRDLRDKAQQLLVPSSQENSATKVAALPFTHVLPLLDFVSDNICSPYPTAEQKRTLLRQCRAAGWTSVTQRKVEDWLNMARVKMGYTLILRSDTIHDDRKLMADCVRRVLFGEAADRAGIPAAITRRIQVMEQWVRNQYESRAAKDQTSSWARDVVDLVQRLSKPDAIRPDSIFDDDDESDLCSDDDESDYSGSDTLYSDTDVEDDFDVFVGSTIGSKRKYSGLGLGQPPSRMVSRTSSSSSLSSHSTLADLSSREVSSATALCTECDDQSHSDRPTKRRRSSLDGSSEEQTSPTPTVGAESPPGKPKLAELSYRSQKRKRSSSEDDSTASPSKRFKYPEATPCGQVASTHIDALESICQLDWDRSSAIAELHDEVDLSAILVDTPSLEIESCSDNLSEAVAACCEPCSSFHLDAGFTWSKLQSYMLDRMLRHGVHIVPSQDSTSMEFTQSITFDASSFGPQELAYLCSLSTDGLGVGQAFVGPPDLGLGADVPDTIGLLQPADTSVPMASDGFMLPSVEVDFDEWYSSLLSTPLVA